MSERISLMMDLRRREESFSPDLLQGINNNSFALVSSYATAVVGRVGPKSEYNNGYSAPRRSSGSDGHRRPPRGWQIIGVWTACGVLVNALVWGAVIARVLALSFDEASKDEKQLGSCLHQVVCNEISSNFGDRVAHLRYEGGSDARLQYNFSEAVGGKAFHIAERGIYLVYSRLVFNAPMDVDTSTVFEHEIKFKERQVPIHRDAQLKKCIRSADRRPVNCHSSVFVATFYMRKNDEIFVKADPMQLLDSAQTLFNVSRLS